MQHSTTDAYQLKREVLNFSARMSAGAPGDWQKFTADMVYGALAKESCILSRFKVERHPPAATRAHRIY